MNDNLLQQKINEKYPDEHIKVLQYSTMKEVATVKCMNCNTEYTLKRAENFLRKDKKCICKRCINNGSGGRLTIMDFQNKINQKYPQEHLLVINYTLENQPCTIRCLNCGKEFTLENAGSFLTKNKQRVCKVCLPNKVKFINNTKNKFLKFINSSQSNFILRQDLNEIRHSNDLVACECKKCHKINQKTMYDYLKHKGCLCSSGNKVLTFSEVEHELPSAFTLVSFEGKARGKMLIRHEGCGLIFKRTRQNNRKILCPKCDKSISAGEKSILEFLENNNINYIAEYTVKIENHNLRFDFYLPDLDKYIEFQGIQHYQSVEYFGGEERLQKQKQYDALKRKYCKNKLLEISYLEFNNIDKILLDFIKVND